LKKASRRRAATARISDPYGLLNTPQLSDFWKEQIRTLGRGLLFVETGFVMASFDPATRAVAEALLKELVSNRLSDKLVTSTYVITEAVRLIVKSKPQRFAGPAGEQNTDLAIYLLFEWLRDNNVLIICPPQCVFNEAKRLFRECRALGCDLTDVLSYVIVRGLEQNRILSHDGHFRALGLTTLLQLPAA